MTVIDASVLVPALIDDTEQGRGIRERLLGRQPAGPELLDLEVGSVLRRLVLSGQLDRERAGRAVHDLRDMPLQRVRHTVLLKRCWELRDAVSFYDASYVALAELLDAPLLTADARLARAPGVRCQVDLVTA